LTPHNHAASQAPPLVLAASAGEFLLQRADSATKEHRCIAAAVDFVNAVGGKAPVLATKGVGPHESDRQLCLAPCFKQPRLPVAEATLGTDPAITCTWTALAPTRSQLLLLPRLSPGYVRIKFVMSSFRLRPLWRHNDGGGKTHLSPRPFRLGHFAFCTESAAFCCHCWIRDPSRRSCCRLKAWKLVSPMQCSRAREH
jgi:hypothetical protein